MVLNHLLPVSLRHFVKSIILAFKLASHLGESARDELLNFVSLFLRDSRAKREVGKVPTHSNPRGLNHGSLLLREGFDLKLGEVHIAHMLVSLLMAVIIFDDLVEQILKSGVTIVTASITADARVNILAAREDHLLEGNSSRIFFTSILLINGWCQVLAYQRLGVCRELNVTCDVLRLLQMSSSLNIGGLCGSFRFFFNNWLDLCLDFDLRRFLGCLGSHELLFSLDHGLDAIVHVLN